MTAGNCLVSWSRGRQVHRKFRSRTRTHAEYQHRTENRRRRNSNPLYPTGDALRAGQRHRLLFRININKRPEVRDSCSSSSSSSSSVGATTLGGFWPALRFRSTIFYLYTFLSSFSLSSFLNPLLLGQAISLLVFLLLSMNMVPSHSVNFLTVLVVSILITCAAQRHLHCDSINITIFFFLIKFSNSSFVFILHALSLSCVGP